MQIPIFFAISVFTSHIISALLTKRLLTKHKIGVLKTLYGARY